MYTYLLEYDLEDERVKEVMVKWAQNFGYNINTDEWIKMWKEYQMIHLRENIPKMFHRCILLL